jgi:hypothetical protein
MLHNCRNIPAPSDGETSRHDAATRSARFRHQPAPPSHHGRTRPREETAMKVRTIILAAAGAVAVMAATPPAEAGGYRQGYNGYHAPRGYHGPAYGHWRPHRPYYAHPPAYWHRPPPVRYVPPPVYRRPPPTLYFGFGM